MEKNGSPDPLIETDEQCTYFLTVLPVNKLFYDQVSNQVSNQVNKQFHFKNIEQCLPRTQSVGGTPILDFRNNHSLIETSKFVNR